MSNSKQCFVPMCASTNVKTPGKMFINVPKVPNKRRAWLKAARRGVNVPNWNTTKYCCDDHFNLEEDMENFMRHKLMKGKIRVRMKDGVVPHIFDCQDVNADVTPSKSRTRPTRRKNSQIDDESASEDEEEEEEAEPFNICNFLKMETIEDEVSDADPLSSDCTSHVSDYPSQVTDYRSTTPVGSLSPAPQVTIVQEPDLYLTVKEEPIYLNEIVEGPPQQFRRMKNECVPCSENLMNCTVGDVVSDVTLCGETDYVANDSRGIVESENECEEMNDTRDESLERAFGMFKRDVVVCGTECASDGQPDEANEVFVRYPEYVDVVGGRHETEQDEMFLEPANGMVEECEYKKENVDIEVEHSDKEAMLLVYQSENASDGFVSGGSMNEPEEVFVFQSSNGDGGFKGNNNEGDDIELERLVHKMDEVGLGKILSGVEHTDFFVENRPNLDEGAETYPYEIHNSEEGGPSQHVDETFVYETRNNDVDFVGVDKQDQAMACEGDGNSVNVNETGRTANDLDGGVYPVALWKYIPKEEEDYTDCTRDTSSNDNADETRTDPIYFDVEDYQDSESEEQNSVDYPPTKRAKRPNRKQVIVPRAELEQQFPHDDSGGDQDCVPTHARAHRKRGRKRRLVRPAIDIDDPHDKPGRKRRCVSPAPLIVDLCDNTEENQRSVLPAQDIDDLCYNMRRKLRSFRHVQGIEDLRDDIGEKRRCVSPAKGIDDQCENIEEEGHCVPPAQCTNDQRNNIEEEGHCVPPAQCTNDQRDNIEEGHCVPPAQCINDQRDNIEEEGHCVPSAQYINYVHENTGENWYSVPPSNGIVEFCDNKGRKWHCVPPTNSMVEFRDNTGRKWHCIPPAHGIAELLDGTLRIPDSSPTTQATSNLCAYEVKEKPRLRRKQSFAEEIDTRFATFKRRSKLPLVGTAFDDEKRLVMSASTVENVTKDCFYLEKQRRKSKLETLIKYVLILEKQKRDLIEDFFAREDERVRMKETRAKENEMNARENEINMEIMKRKKDEMHAEEKKKSREQIEELIARETEWRQSRENEWKLRIEQEQVRVLTERRRERDLIEGHKGETPMIKPSSAPTECGTCGKKLRRKQCFHVA